MSHSTDIIDLTIDSPPVNKRSKLRNKNLKKVSHNSTATTTKQRKSGMIKQQTSFSDSIIEIPTENSCRNMQSTEVIDLDNSNLSDNTDSDNGSSCEQKTNTLSCPICYEELSSNLKPMSTRCGHIFCRNCLELATRNAKKCPLCKKPVIFRYCISLHL